MFRIERKVKGEVEFAPIGKTLPPDRIIGLMQDRAAFLARHGFTVEDASSLGYRVVNKDTREIEVTYKLALA